jgi:7-cyano-7-deazaguanine synthase in queuosine biosynthesis
MSKNGRVLVAMSGGIDSSVTALMLHEQGYQVVGITMKTWDYANSGGSKKETGCCSLDSINDARTLAVNLGFPHYILDIRSEFGDYIIDNFATLTSSGKPYSNEPTNWIANSLPQDTMHKCVKRTFVLWYRRGSTLTKIKVMSFGV